MRTLEAVENTDRVAAIGAHAKAVDRVVDAARASLSLEDISPEKDGDSNNNNSHGVEDAAQDLALEQREQQAAQRRRDAERIERQATVAAAEAEAERLRHEEELQLQQLELRRAQQAQVRGWVCCCCCCDCTN